MTEGSSRTSSASEAGNVHASQGGALRLPRFRLRSMTIDMTTCALVPTVAVRSIRLRREEARATVWMAQVRYRAAPMASGTTPGKVRSSRYRLSSSNPQPGDLRVEVENRRAEVWLCFDGDSSAPCRLPTGSSKA